MKNLFLAILFLIATSSAFAQAAFTAKEFVSSKNDPLNYRELLPENFQSGKKYPLVLFLHGAGERGSDNSSQLAHGSRMFTNPVNREKYPAIVLFPQCPTDSFWSSERRPTAIPKPVEGSPAPALTNSLKELVDKYIAAGNVDISRIYILGLSMGGMGTFDMVCRYPDLFTAAIPICGGINPSRLKAPAGKVHFRIFHGDKDDVVSVENSRSAYKALKAFGADVEYYEIVGCNHGSWDPAFNFPDFFSWMFSQKKK